MTKIYEEVVYYNGGQIYKQQTSQDLATLYIYDEDAHPIFPKTKSDGKKYYPFLEFRKLFDDDEPEFFNTERFDLCPNVKLWVGVGTEDVLGDGDYELYFNVQDIEELTLTAQYYGLPYPIDASIEDPLMNNRESINLWNAKGIHVVLGSVKIYADGTPYMLKLYTYPKDLATWQIWQNGVSYENHGTPVESGAYYIKNTGSQPDDRKDYNQEGSYSTEVQRISDISGGYVTYSNHYTFDEPFCTWKGEEFLDNGQFVRTRYYETSRHFRKLLVDLDSGSNFEDYDRCPDIDFWVARMYYDNSQDTELYFFVDNSVHLNLIADYYDLEYPIDEATTTTLDNNYEYYRIRHYDLFEDDVFVPYVVGGVLFKGGKAASLRMYVFPRPWEADTPFELPDVP